jgi:hypothetical protein
MGKQFLVQEKDLEDRIVSCAIMSEYQLISYIDMSDCYNGIEFEVFDVSEFGVAKHLNYTGWQPHLLIELEDDDGNVIVSGYGTDH